MLIPSAREQIEEDKIALQLTDPVWPSIHYSAPSNTKVYQQNSFVEDLEGMEMNALQCVAERWLREQCLTAEARNTSIPNGEYGNFAFLGESRVEEFMDDVVLSAHLELKYYTRPPIQTEAFLHLPRELRDMIYLALLEPFRNIYGMIFLRLKGYAAFRYSRRFLHLCRPYYDLQLHAFVEEDNGLGCLIQVARDIEALRNLSNTNSQVRQELGELFWKNICLRVEFDSDQTCLPLFFQDRPAITHLSILDMGEINPGWGEPLRILPTLFDRIQRRHRRLANVCSDLAVMDITFDYINIDVLAHGVAQYDIAPPEVWNADIVDILSSFDPSVANNLDANLKRSKYPWINDFRRLSRKIKKGLNLTMIRQTSFLGDIRSENTDWHEHSPLLEWHLCPWKRPTFMSMLGFDLPLPPKKGRDVFYAASGLGKKPDAVAVQREKRGGVEVKKEPAVRAVVRNSLFGGGDEIIFAEKG